MKGLHHPTEEDLIAFQLQESDDEASVRKHLEHCGECSAVSASIAETLRVFSAGPVPEPNMERNWQRLRGNLSVLTPAPRRSIRLLLWPMAGFATAVVALVLFLTVKPRHFETRGGQATSKRGPLTEKPADPEIAGQLESAERLLTEVNHASGPLDETTRTQAHALLVKNAVYIRSAHDRGDLGTASVLENLGRVLTNIDHEPERPNAGWHLRFELNTDGLLFDIRVLRQNDLNQ